MRSFTCWEKEAGAQWAKEKCIADTRSRQKGFTPNPRGLHSLNWRPSPYIRKHKSIKGFLFLKHQFSWIPNPSPWHTRRTESKEKPLKATFNCTREHFSSTSLHILREVFPHYRDCEAPSQSAARAKQGGNALPLCVPLWGKGGKETAGGRQDAQRERQRDKRAAAWSTNWRRPWALLTWWRKEFHRSPGNRLQGREEKESERSDKSPKRLCHTKSTLSLINRPETTSRP